MNKCFTKENLPPGFPRTRLLLYLYSPTYPILSRSKSSRMRAHITRPGPMGSILHRKVAAIFATL
jgi:hypothetical protein